LTESESRAELLLKIECHNKNELFKTLIK
jgi:hypothetical protein